MLAGLVSGIALNKYRCE